MTKTEAMNVIMTLTLVIGNGFHPDNLMSDYIDESGKSSFSDEECKGWDALLSEAKTVLDGDEYSLSMAFMKLNEAFHMTRVDITAELPEIK